MKSSVYDYFACWGTRHSFDILYKSDGWNLLQCVHCAKTIHVKDKEMKNYTKWLNKKK